MTNHYDLRFRKVSPRRYTLKAASQAGPALSPPMQNLVPMTPERLRGELGTLGMIALGIALALFI